MRPLDLDSFPTLTPGTVLEAPPLLPGLCADTMELMVDTNDGTTLRLTASWLGIRFGEWQCQRQKEKLVWMRIR
jgi:hypothetical protein